MRPGGGAHGTVCEAASEGRAIVGRRKAAAASLGSGQAEGTGAAEPGDTAAAADAGHPSSSPPPALPSSSFSPPSPSAGADRERSGEAIPGRFRGSRAGRHREERRPLPGGPAPPPAPRPLSAPRPGLGGEGPAAAPARLPAAAAGSARMSGGGSREEERRKLADIINHWNANRLDLFEISAPTEVSDPGAAPRPGPPGGEAPRPAQAAAAAPPPRGRRAGSRCAARARG